MEAYQPRATNADQAGRLERLMYRNERWMYRGPRPNRMAALLNTVWARIASHGVAPDRLVTLEVMGRRTGRTRSIPLIVADRDGQRYLVAMLGERADWVANVRAARGRAVLHHGHREPVVLEDVPPSERGPIVRRHLQLAPAARSFMPVSRAAAPDVFDAAVRDVPVFRVLPRPEGSPPVAARPARRRRRWAVAIAAGLLVVMAGGLVMVGTSSGPPPLTLPAAAARPPVGSIDGRWVVAGGSTAGFRIDQILLGMHAAVVGRTSAVTGTIEVEDGRVARAAIAVDLTTLTVNAKAPPQIALSFDTADHPLASIELGQSLTLPDGLAIGDQVTVSASGRLTMRGTSHPVVVALSIRRDADTVQAVGSMPVALADWDIPGPAGYGVLGSLADHGVAEFYLVLRRDAG